MTSAEIINFISLPRFTYKYKILTFLDKLFLICKNSDMKDYIIKNKKKIILGALTCLLIGFIYINIGCPFRRIIGVSCPGCGMTRAVFELFKLNFKGAFNAHPLIYVMPIAATVYIFKEKLPEKTYKALVVLLCTVMFITYMIRMLSGSEIVYFKPETGIVYKLIEYIFQSLK